MRYITYLRQVTSAQAVGKSPADAGLLYNLRRYRIII